MKKYELTDAHREKLSDYRDKWIQIAFKTGRMDAETAERVRDGIEAIYRAANLTPPPRQRIVIAPSPFAARFAAGYAAWIWHTRKNGKQAATEAATVAATEAATVAATRAATWAATEDAQPALTKSYTMAGDPTRGASNAMIDCAYRADSMRQGGNMWAGHLSFYNFMREVAQLPIDWEKWIPWEYVSSVSGFRFMHPEFCIVSELPVELHINDNNEAHCETGPYMRWADGSALYAIEGVRVPAWIVLHPERITLKTIEQEDNAEVRRVMMHRYGIKRYIEETDAKCIDYSAGLGLVGSAPRALYRTKDGLQFLFCSDGSTKRIWWLDAPNEAKTCAEVERALNGVDETNCLAEC